MRPEYNSRRLFGITRSKGKMYELGVPVASHIAVPPNVEPQELFLLTVGTLGDVAATISSAENVEVPLPPDMMEELGFSASFFDAFLESQFSQAIARDTALLAASAYYLARRPGSSLVLARQLEDAHEDDPVDRLLHWVLTARWERYPLSNHSFFGKSLENVARLLANHFYDGSGLAELALELVALRVRAYQGGSPRDLLFIDIIAATVRLRGVEWRSRTHCCFSEWVLSASYLVKKLDAFIYRIDRSRLASSCLSRQAGVGRLLPVDIGEKRPKAANHNPKLPTPLI